MASKQTWTLEPGSACEVPDMVERLIHLPQGVEIKDKAFGRATMNHLLVLEVEQKHLPYMERPDFGRGPNRQMCYTRRSEVKPGHYYGKDTKSLDYLLDLHRNGWPEGVAKAMELADAIRDAVPQAEKPRRRPRWADQGDEVSMTRVYNGMLDRAWRSTRKVKSTGPKVVSIDVDVCHNSNISAEALFWSGACAVAITDVLEDMGYRVELFATAVTHEYGNACLTRLVVKRADEPLNINSVAALAAHPATFRYHILKSWCRSPWGIGYGYGHATDMLVPLKAAVEGEAIEGSDIQVTGALSKDGAVKALRAAIAQMDEREAMADL